jgi:hypothetical protein
MKEKLNSTTGEHSGASPCSQFLPCPFCGSEKIEVIYDDGYSVGCKDCSTYVAPFLGDEADSKQKHIDFWNTRAPVCSANASDDRQLPAASRPESNHDENSG